MTLSLANVWMFSNECFCCFIGERASLQWFFSMFVFICLSYKGPRKGLGGGGDFFFIKKLNSLTESFRGTNPDSGKEHLKSCGCHEVVVCILCVWMTNQPPSIPTAVLLNQVSVPVSVTCHFNRQIQTQPARWVTIHILVSLSIPTASGNLVIIWCFRNRSLEVYPAMLSILLVLTARGRWPQGIALWQTAITTRNALIWRLSWKIWFFNLIFFSFVSPREENLLLEQIIQTHTSTFTKCG